ncbi:hypothetical protein [Streptomyces sp. NPDC059071]|uniref:hypothetical protein n=1 Tax=Streptomyces sp. NPDC059071 TaxID=3346714 RepID=UPI0036A4A4D9
MNEGAAGPGRLATFLGAVAAPTGLVTGLLYYFGYFHAYWFFAYFRVNSTVLGFSTADYLMRSLDALWVPLTVAATLGVAVFWGYDLGRRRLGPLMGPVARRRATAALAAIGFLLLAGGLWSTFQVTFLSRVLTLAPLSLSAGVALLAYARHLARRNAAEAPAPQPPAAREPEPAPSPADDGDDQGDGDGNGDGDGTDAAPNTSAAEGADAPPAPGDRPTAPAPDPAPEPAPPSPARPEWAVLAEWAVVFTLVMLGLVWAANDYAASVGTVRAQRFTAGLPHYPTTIVYSEHSLSISGPGVSETRCKDAKGGKDDAAYGYRYDGLTLILQSGNQYVLVPTRWTPADGVALVLPRNDSVRLEFGPPPGAAARGRARVPSC